jgi:hypothetical protein
VITIIGGLNMKLRKLPESYKRDKGAITNTLVAHTDTVAFYEATLGDGTTGSFEVGMAKTSTPYNGPGAVQSEYDRIETKWRDEDFETLAWSYSSRQQAETAFANLTKVLEISL